MSMLKVSLSAALLAVAHGAAHTYLPANDVTAHAKMSLDVLDMQGMIADDAAGAEDIYINGKHREGKNLQGMALKDWAGAGADDTILQAYKTALNGADASFIDTYNLDSMRCSGSFAGESDATCQIALKKNLLCTMLNYAQYEGEKAIAFNNHKNWDELFAFWYGTFDSGENDGKGGPAQVQKSRDGNYDTDFLGVAMDAIMDGAHYIDDAAMLRTYFNKWNAAIVGTFAQATLKYAYETASATDQASIDKKWGEGYTYFRCGAGIMDAALAATVQAAYDPRGADTLPGSTFCTFLNAMVATGDLGYGTTVADLNILAFIPDAANTCGIDAALLAYSGMGHPDEDDHDHDHDDATDSSDDATPTYAPGASDDDDAPATDASDAGDSGAAMLFSIIPAALAAAAAAY
jgi:hypothetical protein